MKLLSVRTQAGVTLAAMRGTVLVDLNAADPGLPRSMKALLALGKSGLSQAAQAATKGPTLSPQTVKILPPIPDPEKIVCIGLNYADHATETKSPIPAEPVCFSKFPTTLIADGDTIVLPAVSTQVDYEAELVAVIGREARKVSEADALAYVAGYTCGHDVSARDWQKGKPGGQWLLGKTFDTFAPCGPAIVTADEIPDPGKLAIKFRLNGQVLQDSSTNQLIFSIAKLVSYVSGVCTLKPGDLIFTGTPSGVGVARTPPIFMKPGDKAEVEIEKIGVLKNPVAGEKS